MSYSRALDKKKYHQKTASDSAIYATYLRVLDAAPTFASYVWLQISAFDLSELGLGLLYSILPTDFQPFTVDFQYSPPTTLETLQGIWANFEPVRFDQLYSWMTDFREYVMENFKEEFQLQLLTGVAQKAIYGVTPYGRGVYDPVVAREFLRATFHRLRLMRTPDTSWLTTMESVVQYLEMIGVTDEHIFNRLTLIFSAQTNAFVLGLSLLGRSRLTETVTEYGVTPFVDAKGVVREAKFTTLDQLQMGLIIGATPLGYGLLLPRESVYKLPEGKKNPPVVKVVTDKIRGMINRLPLSTFAYSNYNRPDEMVDYHRSDKANQYDVLQTQRRMIEQWVEARVPGDEADAVTLRQYQNAVLQAVSWKAKRHRWGFQGWEAMTEEQFRGWWIQYWKGQGLKEETLESLYEDMSTWLQAARDTKLKVGEAVKRARRRLALST